MKEVTDQLLQEGVQLFADAFDKLLNAVEKQSKQPGAGMELNSKLPFG